MLLLPMMTVNRSLLHFSNHCQCTTIFVDQISSISCGTNLNSCGAKVFFLAFTCKQIMRSLLRKLSSLKLKHFILLLLISISVIININFVGTIQKVNIPVNISNLILISNFQTKVLLSSLALHLVCPQPSSTQAGSTVLSLLYGFP